jgi:hypothetical protein
MEEITLGIGVIAAALVLFLSPRRGMLVYLIVLLCYPSYLRIMVSGCTVSVGRIVVAALLMRCLLDEQLRRGFRWIRLDTLIIIADVVYLVVMSCAAGEFFIDVMKLRAGGMMDTTFAYFSMRLIINNRGVLVQFIKVATAILVVMAFLGVFEAVTTITPYKGLMEHRFYADRALGASKFTSQEVMVGHGLETRFDCYRAQGPHPHPILFGASFAVLLPIIWKLLNHTWWKRVRIPVCVAIISGGASSMSSTPFGGIIVAVAGLVFERWRRWGKMLLVFFILCCLFIEIYSEKHHFYYTLMGKLSFLGGAGFDRARLIDAAIKHLPEYWLTGYGFNDPGWGPEVGGADYTDPCIQYIYLVILYGVFGLLAYLAIVSNLLSSLWRKYKKSADPIDRNLCWGLIVSIVVILVIDTGVASYGVLPSIYSIIFGIGGSVVSQGFGCQYANRTPHNLLAVSGISC